MPTKKTRDHHQKKRRTKTRTEIPLGLFFICLLLFFAPSQAQRADVNQAVDVEDIGLTFPLFSGTRPAGLAGAYTAISGDVHSLVYNPAGLAGTNRIEAAIGFEHDGYKNLNRFYGNSSDITRSSTNLGFLSVAYPFPTYRGSLVAAFGIYRSYSSDLDLFYNGFNVDSKTLDTYALQQSGSIFSYNFGFGVDLSPYISGGATFFVLDGTLKVLREYDFLFPPPLNQGELKEVLSSDDVDADIDGYGGKLGIQYHPYPELCFGLAVTTPTWINLGGDGYTEWLEYYENAPDSSFFDSGFIDTDYRLPFKIDFGVSYSPLKKALITAEVGYADWTETTVDKNQLRFKRLNQIGNVGAAVFREVFNFRLGVELTIPRIPVRLRGGYAYLPYPLKYLQADRITNEDLKPANISNERQSFAIGAGALVGKVLSLDAAFVHTYGEREIKTLLYEKESNLFSLSASYRF